MNEKLNKIRQKKELPKLWLPSAPPDWQSA